MLLKISSADEQHLATTHVRPLQRPVRLQLVAVLEFKVFDCGA